MKRNTLHDLLSLIQPFWSWANRKFTPKHIAKASSLSTTLKKWPKPWKEADACIQANIYLPKGMLGCEEREALYWLAREVVRGDGHVIDAGAFCGASALSLAAGLNDSAHSGVRDSMVHSYDMFVAFEQYTSDWIIREFGGTPSQSFRGIFEYQTAPYRDRIVIHSGDILDQVWTCKPVEILFIDLAKSKSLNSHIVKQWFPYLIPGHSVVLQQDFFLARHPWIPITMEYLKEHFTVIDPLIEWCTRAYRLNSPIPPEKIDRISRYDLNRNEERALLEAYLAQEPEGPLRDMGSLISIADYLGAGDHESAYREMESFKRKNIDRLDPIVKSEFEWLDGWYVKAIRRKEN